MVKILTAVGTRPQFIKAAAHSRILRQSQQEILVHTGQHHDVNMSNIFFEELDIPHPDYNLGIAGGTHAQMTGRMLIAIEDVILKEKPDMVLVYGDTNSTLAAALAAVKCQIPVTHVEAGNRVGTLDNPEEVNRIVTDHISTLRFACVESAMESMKKENLLHNAHLVGDPMYDAFLYYKHKSNFNKLDDLIDFNGNRITVKIKYYYLTCHRQENTDDISKLSQILDAMEHLDAPVIYPVHPRNQKDVMSLQNTYQYRNILFSQPIGYLSSLNLISHAEKVITDSGGVQREAFFAGVQSVTVLDFVCWPETMVANRNQLAKPNRGDILQKLAAKQCIDPAYLPFGDGHACERISKIIGEFLSERGRTA